MGASSSSLADGIFLRGPDASGYLDHLSNKSPDIEVKSPRTEDWQQKFEELQGARNMTIFVTMLTNRTIALEVSSEMDALMIMELIEREEQIPVDMQRLIYHGHQLASDRCLADYKIQHESSVKLLLRLRGGGYFLEALEGIVSEAEKQAVIRVYGDVNEYDVFPEDADLHHELYPKLKEFHFVLPEPYSPRILDAISRYTGNGEFARFNCLLHLLNRVTDQVLFNDLMQVCLGSFQDNLPPTVFRCCKMSRKEKSFYSNSVGKKVIIKGFMSTSTTHQPQFGDTAIEVKLVPGRRNGAFFIGAMSNFPNENEVLLCAYSTYLVTECRDDHISLEYCDYYQYGN